MCIWDLADAYCMLRSHPSLLNWANFRSNSKHKTIKKQKFLIVDGSSVLFTNN